MPLSRSLPEAFATAYLNLLIGGGLQEGNTLLMHAGASGLASVIIPMAKAFGARVITSVLDDEKAASIAHLVADRIINFAHENTDDVLKEELAGTKTGIDLKNIYVRNVRIIGSTLRSRTPATKAKILALLVRDFWPKIEAGSVKSTIYKSLPITEAEAAHAILEQGENVGKVVLKVK